MTRDRELFKMQADLCHMLANPKRLMIIDMLGSREMSVGEIAEALGTPSVTASQHLRILRDRRLVATRKEGQTVYYRLAVPQLTEACHMVRSILLDQLKKTSEFAEDLAPEEAHEPT